MAPAAAAAAAAAAGSSGSWWPRLDTLPCPGEVRELSVAGIMGCAACSWCVAAPAHLSQVCTCPLHVHVSVHTGCWRLCTTPMPEGVHTTRDHPPSHVTITCDHHYYQEGPRSWLHPQP
jgi:hypothetical protein